MGNDDIEKWTKLAALATGLLTLATKLGFGVAEMIQKSKDLADADKERLIAEIRAAQKSVPEW